MGTILDFHARASARAAKRVSKSAVAPAELALSVSKIADQYSGGTQSRCHHLVTMPAETPISDAKAKRAPWASLGPHSSIRDRKEFKSVMTDLLGQPVLKIKALLSLDGGRRLGHTVPMSESDTEAQYKQEFMARVAQARIARGWKQWEMAEALGVPQDKYKQYETRGMMPHRYLWRFCMFARIDPQWLLTGQGSRTLKEPPEVTPDIAPAPKASQKGRMRPSKRSVA